jgi:glycosyltransferase involved in cell wall biosynthesis
MLHTQNAFEKLVKTSCLTRQQTSPISDGRAIKVALIGTFAPRKCGIATFTEDLKTKVETHHPHISFDVYALERPDAESQYPPEVGLIAVDDAAAYCAAAGRINASGAGAVWLQHEYGIFGGSDGDLICDLVDRLRVPLIVTFHTILAEPSNNQRAVLRRILDRAAQVMVMSRHGRDLLIGTYGASQDRISVIEHGAPDRPFGREEQFKAKLGLAGRPVLTTFGLLGPGKGLEHAIESLPAIAARHPEIVYRIVGATHPNLLRDEGETYRERLVARVAELGVEGNVVWDDRFLDTSELLDQIEACDIYLTPYPNLQQSTSGTLSYAVALGKAVVSTPYIHARELLAGGVGELVPPGDSFAIAKAVIALLDDPDVLAAFKQRAYARGRSTIWPRFAQASAALIETATGRHPLRDIPYDDRRVHGRQRDQWARHRVHEQLPCPSHMASMVAQSR